MSTVLSTNIPVHTATASGIGTQVVLAAITGKIIRVVYCTITQSATAILTFQSDDGAATNVTPGLKISDTELFFFRPAPKWFDSLVSGNIQYTGGHASTGMVMGYIVINEEAA